MQRSDFFCQSVRGARRPRVRRRLGSPATPSTRAFKKTYFFPFRRLLFFFATGGPSTSRAQDTCFFVARGGDPGGINAGFGFEGGCGTTMKARIVCGERRRQAP